MLEVTLDKRGRVVVPNGLRRNLRLKAGDRLTVEQQGDAMVLRPVRQAVALKKKLGVWVYGTGKVQTLSAKNLVEQDREHRIRELSRCGTSK